MPITNDDITALLYKKFLGVANTKGKAAPYTAEPADSARQRIIPSLQMFKKPIPASAPALTEDTEFSTQNPASAFGLDNSLRPRRWYASDSTYNYIVKYENIPLTQITAATDLTSFKASVNLKTKQTDGSWLAGTNILSNAIPFNLDATASASYAITVKNASGGGPILPNNNSYPWIFEGDAGFLVFYTDISGVMALDVTPLISFWRYEGPMGQNDIQVQNGGAGRIVSTIDSAGNMTANPDVVLSNSILDLSNNAIKLKSVVFDVSQVAVGSGYTIRFPNTRSGYDDPTKAYNLAIDGSGNIVFRDSSVGENKFIDPAGFQLTGGMLDNSGQRLDDLIDNDPNTRLIGLSDTYTTAISKLDNWLYRNIVSSPPTVMDGGVIRTTTTVDVWWMYPKQFNVGIADTYLPAINTFDAVYNINGGADQTIHSSLSKITQSQFVGRASSDVGIRAIRFLKSGSAGYTTTNLTINGTTYNNVPIYTIPVAGLNDTTNQLKIRYNNNNTALSSYYPITFAGYVTAGAPSAPSITNITYGIDTNGVVNSIQIAVTKPTYVDASNPSSTDVIAGYDVSANIISNPNSLTDGFTFRTNVDNTTWNDSNETIIIATPTSGTIYPSTQYSIRVAARNYNLATYGTYSASNTSLTTPVFNAPTLNATLTMNSSSIKYTNGPAKRVADGTTITNDIIKAGNAIVSTASGFNTIPIHTKDRARVLDTAGTIASIAVKVNNVTAATQQYVGFDSGGNGKTYTQVTGNNITIGSATSTDPYAADAGKKKFYLQINSAPQITVGSALVTAKDTSNSIAIVYDASGNPTSTTVLSSPYTYYVDDITGAPTATYSIKLRNPDTRYISGVNTLRGGLIDISANATNIGHYFYRAPFLQYASLGTSPSITVTAESTLANVAASSIITDAGGKRLTDTVHIDNCGNTLSLTGNTTKYSKAIDFTVTPHSLNQSGSAAIPSPMACMFDGPSNNLLNTIYSTALTAGIATGTHLEYNGDSNVPVSNDAYYGSISTIYDHTRSIAAKNDLQITNGAFRTYANTSSSSTGYINYSAFTAGGVITGLPDYSSITNGYRYCIFGWKLAARTYNNGFNITLNGTNNTFNTTTTNGTTTLNNIEMWFRVHNGSATPTYNDSNGGTLSSIWLNGNNSAIASAVSSSNVATTSLSGNINGMRAGGNTKTSTTAVFQVNALPFVVGGSDNYFIYTLMKIDMTASTEFTHVTLTAV